MHTPPFRAAAPLLSSSALDGRGTAILRELVELYVHTGEPVGSRTLSRRLPMGLSPASIRNVMSDLEEAGLIYAPHTSAGRLPTDRGLRLFVDGLLEFGDLGEAEVKDLAPAFRSAAETLQVGQVSDPIRTAAGLHLLAVCGKRASGGEVLTHDQIENRIYGQQLSMIARRYMRDLRNSATIETRN